MKIFNKISKKTILIIIIIFLLSVGIYQGFFKKEEPTFNSAEVIQGNIVQEISETGQVKKGEEVGLSFKNAGRIEKIYVEVGDIIKFQQPLIKIETTQSFIQLKEAQAALELAQAKFNQLLAGASQEEIKLAETKVANAQTSLENARQNLENIEASAEEDLNNAYEDALNTLEASYLKIYNAFNVTDLVQRSYFTGSDQEGLKVRENKTKIDNALNWVRPYLDTAKAEANNENIDSALSEMKESLNKTYNALELIREACETAVYRGLVSSTDKTSLDNQRTYINTALTNTANSRQNISSVKVTNQYDINTAESTVSEAEGALKSAQDELTLIKAPSRQEDIDLYQAQVDQAQAQVQLLENQIQEAILKSPTSGQVTKITKRIGEMVQPAPKDPVLSLLPASQFEIEVDIYEEDVVKMNIGNTVEISLIAFPEQSFQGKVLFIDPAEKLIEGVVYYETTVVFEEMPEGIKPGMTADLIIKTASRENVLIIPEEAIQEKEDKTIVEVLKNGLTEEREIKIGLQGSNDMVEVISGLEQGEKVIFE